MNFCAKAMRISFSPYKLRPIVDVIRGKSVSQALAWLSTYQVKRVVPIRKLVESALANAVYAHEDLDVERLIVGEIKVDQGPTRKYFKPGAMGRAMPQKKRTSHISVVLTVKA
ncbi:50S ribosomal protein L22 [bacterium]|jgi:large subunit ribosomal protein L22|nr:50S ribosomal protein L22 [bacterium]MBT3903514.1 50S ribosomal protein L22 [bacterium]MBT4577946.1 50S ribosomal protein L22 [bacterium]MBT5346110.1 50S ribosomal protein L22 [bacterium]MBT6131379.1 50S ribosomal protein L22 [bacterium]